MIKNASALLRECREGKHGEEARKVVEELDCLAAPRMMCVHEWAFLRQEVEAYTMAATAEDGRSIDSRQVETKSDVFYCRRCLTYRRVEGE